LVVLLIAEVYLEVLQDLVQDEDQLLLIVKLEDLMVHLVPEFVQIVLVESHLVRLQLEQDIQDSIQQRTLFCTQLNIYYTTTYFVCQICPRQEKETERSRHPFGV
jgi:hypothetical protein